MKCQESLVLFKVSGNLLSKQVENLQVRNVLPQALPQKHEKPSSQIEKAALIQLLCSDNTPQDITGFIFAIVRCTAKVPPFSEIVTFLILNFYSSHCKGNVSRVQPIEDQDSS